MKTKQEAEERLSRCDLVRQVAVADVATDGKPRRTYTFLNTDDPDGPYTIVEIDAEPTDQQLADLALHLPVDDDAKRPGILQQLRAAASIPIVNDEPVKAAALFAARAEIQPFALVTDEPATLTDTLTPSNNNDAASLAATLIGAAAAAAEIAHQLGLF